MANGNDTEEDSKSIFNAGVAQTERIHHLQDTINYVRFNPLAINQDMGIFNYEIILRCLESLYSEVHAKLTPAEVIEGERWRIVISDFIEYNNPITYRQDRNSNIKPQINKDKWKMFYELLIKYEFLIKRFLDKHDLNNPNKYFDDEGL